MTRFKPARSTLLLILTLFILLSLGVSKISTVRQASSSFLSWRGWFSNTPSSQENNLILENKLLHKHIEKLEHLLTSEAELIAMAAEVKDASTFPEPMQIRWNERQSELLSLIEQKLDAIPAQIIFRSPTSWSSSVWIDVGSQTNKIVMKHSPVVVGTSIVGLIEEVTPSKSRVRLLTDSSLRPSVRVSREGSLLAKGELRGSSAPIWRGKRQILEGIGFSYDFADEEGPARDLRTGKILRVGDLLVTTGFDGLFPPGFQVATVTKIEPLREGDYYYNLEAKPTAGNLDQLQYVQVLPSLER